MTGAGSDRSALRRVLAAVAVLDLISFFFFLGEDRGIGIAHATLTGYSDLVSRPLITGLIVSIGVAGAIAFGRRAGRLWPGAVALVALAVLSTAHAQLFGSPWRHLYYSGLCLLGWLLGLAFGRLRGTPADESYARAGSIALLAAAYLNAGLSKMAFGGLEWLSGVPIQAAIVAQDGLVSDGVLSLYRLWVVETPAVARLLSLATEGFELAAPLMLAGPIPRACVVLGLFAFHANIFLLTPILYWQPMVLLVAFGFSADEPSPRGPAGVEDKVRSDTRRFLAVAALLAVGALLGIEHQARRYVAVRGAGGALSASQPANRRAVPATPNLRSDAGRPPLHRIGPFEVGQRLAPGWAVDALEIRDDGVVVWMTGSAGRAAFDVSCTETESRSPFDLGAMHIFFSSDLEPRDLEAPGNAVRELVRASTEGRDPCAALADWRRRTQMTTEPSTPPNR